MNVLTSEALRNRQNTKDGTNNTNPLVEQTVCRKRFHKVNIISQKLLRVIEQCMFVIGLGAPGSGFKLLFLPVQTEPATWRLTQTALWTPETATSHLHN